MAAPKKKAPAAKTTAQKGAKKADVSAEDAQVQQFLKGLESTGVLGDLSKEPVFIPSGSIMADRSLGNGDGNGSPGGFARGFLYEIFGNPGSGKTTLALQAAVEYQKRGHRVVWFDFERALRAQVKYAKRLGLDTSADRFVLVEPKNYEDGIAQLGKALVMFKPPLVVVDSLAAAMPKDAASGDMGQGVQVGLHAKLTGQFLSMATKMITTSDTCLIVLNQTRKLIKTGPGANYGPNEESTGGEAIKFYPHARMEVKAIGKVKAEGVNEATGASEDKITDLKVKLTPIKNRFDKPFVSAVGYISFGKGFDNVRSLFEMAVNKGVIKQSGSWFEYVSKSNPEMSLKVQGGDKLMARMREDEEFSRDIESQISFDVDRAEMFLAAKRGILDEDTAKEVEEQQLSKEDKEALEALEKLNKDLGVEGDIDLEAASLDDLA